MTRGRVATSTTPRTNSSTESASAGLSTVPPRPEIRASERKKSAVSRDPGVSHTQPVKPNTAVTIHATVTVQLTTVITKSSSIVCSR